MNARNTIILMVLVAAASAGITRYCFPQVQVKSVEVTKEVVKNNIQTVIKTVVLKDGTTETTETINDQSTKLATDKKELTIAKKNDWMFDVGARVKIDDRELILYDLQVQRRILGPFFLGAKLSTDKSVGLSVGMEF
jgi:restriction endonuclease